jgi:hypothetical protein
MDHIRTSKPLLVVLPTQPLRTEWLRQRLDPLIEATPEVAAAPMDPGLATSSSTPRPGPPPQPLRHQARPPQRGHRLLGLRRRRRQPPARQRPPG